MVRDGENTKSNQLDDRLSTGALVEEAELKGNRLRASSWRRVCRRASKSVMNVASNSQRTIAKHRRPR